MRVAYLEATFGLSGDKILAALLDAGADEHGLAEALGSLDLGLSVEVEPVTVGSISAKRVTISAPELQQHRTWGQISSLIARSALRESVTRDVLAVFERIANAEAAIHGIPPADVHFHEVGAADSIGDIVGCVWCLHHLGVERLVCSEITTGSGTVETEHGPLPIPAPATASILLGVPIMGGSEPFEMTTPTGAALAAVLADSFGPPPAMTVASIGTGAGTHATTVPNICRVFVGDAEFTPSAETQTQSLVILATTLDDITPEHLAFAVEELLGKGALDVWRREVWMKKGRVGTNVEVLAHPEDARRLSEDVMKLTGSPGVRMSVVQRNIAPREIIEVESVWGPARVKVARLPGRIVTHAEYEDCARIARARGLAPEDVSRTLEELARDQLEDENASSGE